MGINNSNDYSLAGRLGIELTPEETSNILNHYYPNLEALVLSSLLF